MEDTQPQVIGIQDEILLKMVRGYASLENGFLIQQRQHREDTERMQDILRTHGDRATTLEQENAELRNRIAALEAHRCPVLGEFGEGDDPRTLTLVSSAESA